MSLPGVDHAFVLLAWLFLQYLLQGSLVGALGLVVEARWLQVGQETRYRLLELCSAIFWLLPLLLLLGGALRQLHSVLQTTTGPAANPGIISALLLPLKPVFTSNGPLFLMIWLGGSVLLLAHLLRSWLRLQSLELQPCPQDFLVFPVHDHCTISFGQVYTADVTAPLVFGAARPRIVIPDNLPAILRQDEARAVLLHELAHVQRRDYLRNLIQRTCACVFWFHPVSWLLLNRLAAHRELCCDAEAARVCQPATLGRALVKLLENGCRPSLIAIELSSLSGAVESRLLALLRGDGVSLGGAGTGTLRVLLPAILAGLSALAVLCPSQIEFLRLAQDPQTFVRAQDDAGPFELRVRGGRVFQATIGNEVVPARMIAQQGTSVSLLSEAGKPMLVLTVEPSGSVRWQSRARR